MVKKLFFAPFLLLFFAIFSCTTQSQSNILSSDVMADSVSQIMEESTVFAYREENKHWRLDAQQILQMTETNQIRVNPVRFTIFDENQRETAVLLADSGVANQRTDTIFVWGNVDISAYSGEQLLTQTLSWHTRDRILVSEDFVELRSGDGEVIRGRGFRAAENFEWWEFAEQVTGHFPSIYAEFEQGRR